MAIDYSKPRRDYRVDRGGVDVPRTPPLTTESQINRQERTSETPSQGEGRPSNDGTFILITQLFPSKSGKADTVFIKSGSDIIKKLGDVREGDTLGVSVSKKNQRLMLWFIAKD